MPTEVGDDAREYLRGASDAIIRCRLYRHAWDPVDGPGVFTVEGRGRDRTCTQAVECMRCGTGGVDHFDPVTLRPIGHREYDYADGYLREPGSGRLAQHEVRAYVFNRSKVRRRVDVRRLKSVG